MLILQNESLIIICFLSCGLMQISTTFLCLRFYLISQQFKSISHGTHFLLIGRQCMALFSMKQREFLLFPTDRNYVPLETIIFTYHTVCLLVYKFSLLRIFNKIIKVYMHIPSDRLPLLGMLEQAKILVNY